MRMAIVGPPASGRHSYSLTQPFASHAKYILSCIPCRSCSRRSTLPRPQKRQFPKYAMSSETSTQGSVYFCHTLPNCVPSTQHCQPMGKEWEKTYTRLNNPLIQSSRAFSIVIQRFSSTRRRSQRSSAASYAVMFPVRIAVINGENSSSSTGNRSRSILDGKWPRRMRKGIKHVKIRL